MIHLKDAVAEALKDVCENVVYGDPRGFAVDRLLAWRESANRCYARADGREYLAEINYALEIYAPDASEAATILEEADARLCALGFRREAAVEQMEQDMQASHVSARYRALTDGRGNVYQ